MSSNIQIPLGRKAPFSSTQLSHNVLLFAQFGLLFSASRKKCALLVGGVNFRSFQQIYHSNWKNETHLRHGLISELYDGKHQRVVEWAD